MPRHDTRTWNFVMGDDTGHQIDCHVITLDEHGRGTYGPPENGEYYPAEVLPGKGTVMDRIVECITPAWLVRFTLATASTRATGLTCPRCASVSAFRCQASTYASGSWTPDQGIE